jgi:hypothetical protein
MGKKVSSVMFWYRCGHFRSEAEALGAFKLAHQQGLDGMGDSVREWLGMTENEFRQWMVREELPLKSSKRKAA